MVLVLFSVEFSGFLADFPLELGKNFQCRSFPRDFFRFPTKSTEKFLFVFIVKLAINTSLFCLFLIIPRFEFKSSNTNSDTAVLKRKCNDSSVDHAKI
jgi:hypothetical protein